MANFNNNRNVILRLVKRKKHNIKQTTYPLMRSSDTGLIMCCSQW